MPATQTERPTMLGQDPRVVIARDADPEALARICAAAEANKDRLDVLFTHPKLSGGTPIPAGHTCHLAIRGRELLGTIEISPDLCVSPPELPSHKGDLVALLTERAPDLRWWLDPPPASDQQPHGQGPDPERCALMLTLSGPWPER